MNLITCFCLSIEIIDCQLNYIEGKLFVVNQTKRYS